MNRFLTVSRNDYLWESEDFKEFYSDVENIIHHLNTDLRKAWNHEASDFTNWLAEEENLELLNRIKGKESDESNQKLI